MLPLLAHHEPHAGATSASLLRCQLAANTAFSGGGAAATFGPVALSLQSCALLNNTAGADGGALALSAGAAVAIAGSVLANNSAGAYGAVYNHLPLSSTGAELVSYSADSAMNGSNNCRCMNSCCYCHHHLLLLFSDIINVINN